MKSMLLLLLCLVWCLVEVRSQTEYPYISFLGKALRNHSYVNLSQVGENRTGSDSNTVQCHTDLDTCCSVNQGIHRGDWFAPGSDRRLPVLRKGGEIYENRRPQVVHLRRRSNAAGPSGIYHCFIATTDVHDDDEKFSGEAVYVGLYTGGGGIITIPDGMEFYVDYDLNGPSPQDQFTLTCISTGGPATTVTWTRDSVTVTEGTKTVLNDSTTSQYSHTLTVTGRLGGIYTCTVANNRPSEASADLNVEAPSPPSGVTVSQNGVDSVQVSWTPPPGEPPVTGYIIYYQQQDGEHTDYEMAGATATTTTVTGLIIGATYSITMVTTSSTLPSTMTVAENITIGGVLLSSNVAVSPTSLTILWTLAGDLTAVSVYNISYFNTNTQCFIDSNNITGGATATWKVLTGLQEGTQYTITVTVLLSNGWYGANSTTVTTRDTAPSAAPTSVSVSAVTSSSITVQWGAVDCIHHNGDITGYSVRYGVQGSYDKNRTVEMATGDSNGGMYTISGLSPATIYTVEVAAVNSATGIYSDPRDQLTLVAAPSITVDLSVTVSSTIPLTWTSAGPVVDSYVVMWIAGGECSGVSGGNASVDGDTTSYTIEGLEEYTTYTITVSATNAVGSEESDQVTIWTTEAHPSGSPTSVNASAVTTTSITVQWGAVDCIHHNGNITGYSVRYGVQGIDQGNKTVEIPIGDSSGGMYIISGLSAATVYTVEVAAVNSAGTGVYSDPITAETLQKHNFNSTPRPVQKFSSTATIAISATVVIVSLAVTSVIMLYFCFKKKIVKNTDMTQDLNVDTNLENQYSLIQPKESPLLQQLRTELKDKRMMVSKEQVHLTSAVGHGESGLVYKGYIDTPLGSELVAVKTGKALFSSGDLERLTKEISTMLSFKHPNVMSLIGVCLDGEMPLLIMPFMSNGNILEYVRHHKQELLLDIEATDEEVQAAKGTYLKMCHQITKGMTYLAKQKFVHRDLAARNCMINGSGVIKVADFGLTEDIYCTNYFRRRKSLMENEERVPIRWMAPESIENDIYNESTDVWSFGVTVWELFTCGSVPYSGIPIMCVLKALKAGHRLEKPENLACSNEIYDLMTSCWDLDSHQRPKFANLQCDVSDLLETAAGYMELSSSFHEEEPINRSTSALMSMEIGTT